MIDPLVAGFALAYFVLLGGFEITWAIRGGRGHNPSDTVNNLSMGIYRVLTDILGGVWGIWIYSLVYSELRLFTLSSTVLPAWLLGWLMHEFCAYWEHRLGHERNLLWADHSQHHGSEEFNLSTALRQPSFVFLYSPLFNLPLALAGIPVEIYLGTVVFSTLYGFWIHTESIGRLGWFDRLFNSPANHRVHHAVNPVYIDRNYGLVIMLWDHLFGTYQEELASDPPVYGVRKPVRSFNPLESVFQNLRHLFLDALRTRSWRDRLLIWFRPTGWRPADVAASDPRPTFALERFRKHPAQAERPWVLYVPTQFFLVGGLFVFFVFLESSLPPATRWLVAGELVVGLYVLGTILDGKPYSAILEWFRHGIRFGIATHLAGLGLTDALSGILLPALLLLGVVSACGYGALRLRGVPMHRAGAGPAPAALDTRPVQCSSAAL